MRTEFDKWMPVSRTMIAATVAAGLLLAAGAMAAVPEATHLEGTLVSAGFGPITDGTYALTVRLYAQAEGGEAVWTEGPTNVAVHNGTFSYRLGAKTPLTASALVTARFIGYQVGNDPELGRKELASSAFALRTAVAEQVDCSGCLPMSVLDPQVFAGFAKVADLAAVATSGNYADLAGTPDVSVYAKIADLATVASSGAYSDLSGTPDLSVYANATDLDVLAKTASLNAYAKSADLAAFATTGSFNDLQDTPAIVAVGQACGTGLVVAGILGDGAVDCVESKAAPLKPDDIAIVSNGLVTNVFSDVFSSTKTPLGIPDNNPTGTSDAIVVGDLGLAQKLTVTVKVLNNSDLTGVTVNLIDPLGTKFVLYDKGGKKGDNIDTSYPDVTKPVSGDLTTWAGKNPKGTWYLQVIDVKFLNNTTDGQLTAWSINVQTLSNKKVQVKGDLLVGGSLAIGKGSIFPAGSVLPFNLASCPTGWLPADGGSGTIDMRGRIPLVTGDLPYGGTVALNAAGGSHMWRIYAAGGYGGNRCGGSSEMGSWGIGWQAESDVTMGMNNNWVGYTNHLPPYTGVLFCQKQ
ncbi:MAG: proprotein convertase P-domain-containing protein [Myxococcota bacterium]